jgi:hypothetical protein
MTQDAAGVAEEVSAELAWRERCPKPVLFEIALQLAILANGDEDRTAALARLSEEWEILREAKLLPDQMPARAAELPAYPAAAPAAVRRTLFEALGLRLRWPFSR